MASNSKKENKGLVSLTRQSDLYAIGDLPRILNILEEVEALAGAPRAQSSNNQLVQLACDLDEHRHEVNLGPRMSRSAYVADVVRDHIAGLVKLLDVVTGMGELDPEGARYELKERADRLKKYIHEEWAVIQGHKSQDAIKETERRMAEFSSRPVDD